LSFSKLTPWQFFYKSKKPFTQTLIVLSLVFLLHVFKIILKEAKFHKNTEIISALPCWLTIDIETAFSTLLERTVQSFHRIHTMKIPSQCILTSPKQAGLQISAIEFRSGKFGGHTDRDWTRSPAIQADVLTTTPHHPGTNTITFALSHSTMDHYRNIWPNGTDQGHEYWQGEAHNYKSLKLQTEFQGTHLPAGTFDSDSYL